MVEASSNQTRPMVYIVGGGFAGLEAARQLAGAPVQVTLVDQRNHHVFQPLLYQVATASLSPGDISAAIRTVLRGQSNCDVALARVTGVDLAERRLFVEGGYARYDYLILAAGATHSYFGNQHWAAVAPGLKSLEDATDLRRRILLAFETAEYEGSPGARQAALTFGIVGAGPTGVELAGAIKEIAGKTIPEDYRHIDTRTTRVILFEAGDRVLPTFPDKLSQRALRDLERMGVEVRLNAPVTDIRPGEVHISAEVIPIRNVFWAAGVKASSVGESLGVSLDRSGRVRVQEDLTVPGHPEVFVVGDMAAVTTSGSAEPVPGVAPAALQMGRYAGRVVAREAGGLGGKAGDTLERKPFVYRDKGMMAIIGKARAVAAVGPVEAGGFLAWLLWGGVHIASLIGFRSRLQVLLSWFWSWLLNARDVRLITGEASLELETPRPPDFVPTSRDHQAPSNDGDSFTDRRTTGPP